jgi:hypothetical protein
MLPIHWQVAILLPFSQPAGTAQTPVKMARSTATGEVWGWCSCWSSKPVGLRKGTGRFDSYLLPPDMTLTIQGREGRPLHTIAWSHYRASSRTPPTPDEAPNEAVTMRLPLASKITPAFGSAPSLPSGNSYKML